MDEMVRKDKHQEYINRLDKARDNINEQHNSHYLRDKMESLSHVLKESEDINEFNLVKGLLAGAILLILTFGYIKFGFTLRYLPAIILLIAFVIYYRITMKSVHEKNRLYSNANVSGDDDQPDILQKLKYLITGTDIKLARIHLVRVFFTAMFPVFLFYLRDVLYGPDESMLIKVLLAVLFGSIFWWFYFKEDYEEMKTIKTELKDIETKYLTSVGI